MEKCYCAIDIKILVINTSEMPLDNQKVHIS